MIKEFKFEKKKVSTASEPLPAGGYVAKIMGVENAIYDWGNVLIISFDIDDGEHKGFFTKQYKENTNEDKKWKGNYRLRVPDEKNQYFESQKKTFGNFIACVEESNDGYVFDWDETKLKGKLIGVLFRNEEWEYDGSTGWTTKCCAVVGVEDIKQGKFKTPKDKPLKKTVTPSVNDFATSTADDDEDLPF